MLTKTLNSIDMTSAKRIALQSELIDILERMCAQKYKEHYELTQAHSDLTVRMLKLGVSEEQLGWYGEQNG